MAFESLEMGLELAIHLLLSPVSTGMGLLAFWPRPDRAGNCLGELEPVPLGRWIHNRR